MDNGWLGSVVVGRRTCFKRSPVRPAAVHCQVT